uniref:Uncharacterized protein n=1 Tax=Anguilla anguilla TaxID=7936 RepID=A0A0E9P924_ANGAN
MLYDRFRSTPFNALIWPIFCCAQPIFCPLLMVNFQGMCTYYSCDCA